MFEKLNKILESMSSHNYIANFAPSWENWCGKYIPTYMSFELWMALALCIFVGVLLIFYHTRLHKLVYKVIVRYLSELSIVVWLLGIAIYTIGFTDNKLNVFAVLPRVIISSFKMFTISNELARVDSTLHHDAIYMTAFSLIHFCAACITFIFIFRMIGYKLRCSMRLKYYKLFCAKGKNVHLFWGTNEASLLLAENIDNNKKKENHNNEDNEGIKVRRDDIIIFVDVDKECEDNCQKKPSLSYLTNTITIKDSDISRLDKIGALVGHCYNGPASIDTSKNNDIFAQLRLNAIRKILQKCDSFNIYLLSDDEADNISAALKLQDDENLKKLNK